MPTILLAFVSLVLLIASPCLSTAAPLKTYVAEFTVTGAPNRDELKVTLQGLLASRLNPNQVQLVDKPDKAELLLDGSYALFGKMFSIDVLLKNSLTGTMTKVFEMGESQDDMLPAFGRLAQKIDRELAKAPAVAAAPAVPVPSPVLAPSPLPRSLPSPAGYGSRRCPQSRPSCCEGGDRLHRKVRSARPQRSRDTGQAIP